MRIYVAGHTGLVGSALRKKIESSSSHSFLGKSRAELDLFVKADLVAFLESEKPDAIIVAAARVGGIGANSSFPVEFLLDNLKLEINILEAAHECDIPKVLFLGSSCIYPKFASQPIREDQLLSGALETSNESYALAKIAGIKLVSAYRKEYGRKWISAMPCNIFGERDNFDLETGHVLPALIRKFHDAKTTGQSSVSLWGSGAPMREFLHADDLADACLFLLSEFDSDIHINVGSGNEVSIKELAFIIADVVGFTGDVYWDHSKPDGTPRKILDSTKINRLGWKSKIDLRAGIESTYDWFLINYPK